MGERGLHAAGAAVHRRSEGALAEHPAVAEAVVVAVPDDRWRERPLAAVSLRDETVEVHCLRDFLAERVAAWMVPERWVLMAEAPKTSVGMYDKCRIRNQNACHLLDVIHLGHQRPACPPPTGWRRRRWNEAGRGARPEVPGVAWHTSPTGHRDVQDRDGPLSVTAREGEGSYTHAHHLARGRGDPAFLTKPQPALCPLGLRHGGGLRLRGSGHRLRLLRQRRLLSRTAYGGTVYVVALKPHRGTWDPCGQPHTPTEATRAPTWRDAKHPGLDSRGASLPRRAYRILVGC
ncbi:hypothetical protein ACFVOK_38025 [Streptomyces sp. NPDC057798]|uniref:AMP-binding enzyme n=1 Tax=Streptomyces sp. NPDC057798 TaxID=3346252 RepID=UPI0036880AE8